MDLGYDLLMNPKKMIRHTMRETPRPTSLEIKSKILSQLDILDEPLTEFNLDKIISLTLDIYDPQQTPKMLPSKKPELKKMTIPELDRSKKISIFPSKSPFDITKTF